MTSGRGKRYEAALKLLEDKDLVDPKEGIRLVKAVNSSTFAGTVELHIRLGVDPRHADQMVRSSVVLPHGTGKHRRIAVFAQGEKEREARDAGADIVGAEDLVKKVQEGFTDFDVALATPDMMGSVGRLGKILGPRGLMPNPKAGTVTFDIARAVRDVQAGRVEFRVDRYGIIHVPVGKTSFEDDALYENLSAMMEAIMKAKPSAAKGSYLRACFLAPTMGPSVKLDPAAAARLSVA
ncbi:MAG TPA: 50S ribosomal protein L1 [Candidatus Nanopelagicaceae bacterium]|nr:50S ribosomal protein L1 [Candidatus Nanopelagicaceae bacterium]